MFARPLREPVMSCDFIGAIPVLCSFSNSSYSVVSFNVERDLTFSCASCIVFDFIFSRTSIGFTAMYFTGFPILTIANPLFSRDSKTSYVLERGTPERAATSPADAIPFESRASQTLVS